MKGIDGRARSAKRGMFFVSGSFGLIPHDQPVNSDLKTFTETDIEGILPRVRNSLIKYQIDGITFYLNPTEKQGLAYLRLLVIACYLQRKTLTARSFKDEEFPDWMESMREAKLTRERARGLRDKPDRIKESFDLLLKKYGRDPMILFEQANTYADLDNFEAAAKDYEEAARLLPLPEFENLAHQKARAEKRRSGALLPATSDPPSWSKESRGPNRIRA
ncbi:MAG TPA: hypothetical protein VMV13_04365 [Candidatus Binataceae bacterium]|nr:hypothetical protein [Candidatus Binataceae bacterium]